MTLRLARIRFRHCWGTEKKYKDPVKTLKQESNGKLSNFLKQFGISDRDMMVIDREWDLNKEVERVKLEERIKSNKHLLLVIYEVD